MSVVKHFVVRKAGTIERSESLSAALPLVSDDAFLWIDVENPEGPELSELIAPLGLHPLAVEDCLDDDQVPKIEEFPNHTFILFNRCRTVDQAVEIDEINLFVGPWFVLTVHSRGLEGDRFGERLETLLHREIEKVCHGPDHLLQVVLDDVVDEEFEAIEVLQEQLDGIEEEVFAGVSEFRPGRLIRLRRNLLLLRKSLVYEREILIKLCRRDSPFVSEQAIYGFRDIYDHLAKFFEVVEICRELIGSIIEIHLSVINNHMAMVGNKTNLVMRRLTMITVVFMPLTLLASVGGMSEWTMMTGEENWPISYPIFLLLMAVIALFSYRLLQWLDARDPVEMPPWLVLDDDGEGERQGG